MSTLPTISALGTQFFIEIFDEEAGEAKLDAAYCSIQLLLTTFEENYSRFKPHSLLSRLNADRQLENPPLEFVELLNLGLRLYEETDGIFNLLVGETLNARGYDANYSFKSVAEPDQIPNPIQSLVITKNKIILKDGLIDLGGYGKGYAIDLIAELLRTKYGFLFFLINGGGDIYGTSENESPITIYLEHPTEKETYVGATRIYNCGFAASSPHKRQWKDGATTHNHIVDTKKENGNKPDASFITAPSALMADVFGTVALIASDEKMSEFAGKESLGVATFNLPHTFYHNQQFDLLCLD